MKTKHYPKYQAGFSLIEIIVTMAIITIGLLTTLTFISHSIAFSIRNRHITIAYNRLNQAIEETRSLPYANLANGTATQTVSSLTSGLLTKTIGNYNGDTNIKEITITVTWSEKGRTETVTATTLATLGGLND